MFATVKLSAQWTSRNVRTMFVQWQKEVRTLFVQCPTKLRTILYELFFAIVRTLYELCVYHPVHQRLMVFQKKHQQTGPHILQGFCY